MKLRTILLELLSTMSIPLVSRNLTHAFPVPKPLYGSVGVFPLGIQPPRQALRHGDLVTGVSGGELPGLSCDRDGLSGLFGNWDWLSGE